VPGWHAVGGVAGLGLQVTPTGARSWSLRTLIAGKRREIGLGGFPTVQLAAARDKARQTREMISQGIDPVLAKQTAASALRAAQARAVTFQTIAEQYIEAHEAGWGNPKHAAQWASTLKQYAYPDLGNLLVASIDTAAVLKVAAPSSGPRRPRRRADCAGASSASWTTPRLKDCATDPTRRAGRGTSP
jgi:hypothetical protein